MLKQTRIPILLCFLLFACERNTTGDNTPVKTEARSGSLVSCNFKVWGNCETCKENIETSLKVTGITSADWNTETKMIQVSYDTTKISLDQIEKNIAAAGYDNVAYKGDDKAYAELAPCCQYDRKK